MEYIQLAALITAWPTYFLMNDLYSNILNSFSAPGVCIVRTIISN